MTPNRSLAPAARPLTVWLLDAGPLLVGLLLIVAKFALLVGRFTEGQGLALLIVLPTSLAFSMLAAAMPRSGGDYVYVSRILGPRLGMTSSWTNTIWWFIYGGVPSAFFARYGLGPLFRNVGLLSGNSSLVDIGSWFVTPTGTIITGAGSQTTRPRLVMSHAQLRFIRNYSTRLARTSRKRRSA